MRNLVIVLFHLQHLSITLGETEKGIVSSIEHVGHPSNVKSEMGTNWSTTSRMKTIHHNWWNSTYLSERKEYLKDVINELDPHKPVSCLKTIVCYKSSGYPAISKLLSHY